MAESQGIADTVDAVTQLSPAWTSSWSNEDAIEGMTAFARNAAPNGSTADPSATGDGHCWHRIEWRR